MKAGIQEGWDSSPAVAGTSWFGKKGFAHMGTFVREQQCPPCAQEVECAVLNIMPAPPSGANRHENIFCLGAVLNRVAEALAWTRRT